MIRILKNTITVVKYAFLASLFLFLIVISGIFSVKTIMTFLPKEFLTGDVPIAIWPIVFIWAFLTFFILKVFSYII
jgi:hypothetical protein